MAKITNLGRTECKALSNELELVIQRTLNKYGLDVSCQGASYSGHSATLKFKIDAPDQAEAVANSYAGLLGAKFEVGHVFTSNGLDFKVTGFNPKRHKYPVTADSIKSGRHYKFSVEDIHKHLAIPKVEVFEKNLR